MNTWLLNLAHCAVAPRGATWCHVAPPGATVAPPWCYSGATFARMVAPHVQKWHHCSTMVVPQWRQVVPCGTTWCHVAPRGATGGTTLHHQVVPLFFYACRPYNRVRTGWCHQILVWSVEQTKLIYRL